MSIAKIPNRNGRIVAYALAGLYGLAFFVVGASWFVAGKGALVVNFPSSLAEAVAGTAGGAVVAVWAVARIRRERRAGG